MERACPPTWMVLPTLWLAGCYLAHEAPGGAPGAIAEGPCGDTPPRCVVQDDPCAARRLVDATCIDDQWSCPAGPPADEPPWLDDHCTPLIGQIDPFVDGVHDAPVPVPIDGECRWLVPLSGPQLPAPNHIPARPGRACDEVQLLSRTPVVDVDDPSTFVGIQASFDDALGATRLLVRGWRYEPGAPFGVRDLGVGLATVDGGRVRVGDTWLFEPDIDLGDAAVRHGDHVYAYGCPGPPDALEENCIVGRAELEAIDDPDAWQLLGDDGWGRGEPARVFGSGPHRGPVFVDPRGEGFVHVYAIGFGSDLMITRADAPEGPWSNPQTLARCELPDDDPDAYCAGPVVYESLWDPFDPDRIVIGYSIGTTAPDGGDRRIARPQDYWPRLVRIPF